MNLMMVLFFACALAGMVLPRLGRREGVAIGGFAAFLTFLYYLFPARFM